MYNNAVVVLAQKLKHLPKHTIGTILGLASSSLGGCSVLLTAQKKIFWAREPLHLIRKRMNCSVCTAHWT